MLNTTAQEYDMVHHHVFSSVDLHLSKCLFLGCVSSGI